jgi:primase-polymerase (primpol)-like protein
VKSGFNNNLDKFMNPIVEKYSDVRRWVMFRIEERDGKKTKVPFQINGEHASSTDAATWSNHKEVEETYHKKSEEFDGIGIVLLPDKKLLCLDIDHCLKEEKIINECDHLNRFIENADTYCEVSPSGEGLHVFFEITESFDLVSNKKAPFELYVSGRYMTFTGNIFGQAKALRTVTPDEALELLAIIGYPWKKIESSQRNSTLILSDQAVIDRMFKSKHGKDIKILYDGDTTAYDNDDSRADMALCTHLAFWTGKNIEQIERLWSASLLGSRRKVQERKDYRDRTIDAAISNCKETYSPRIQAERVGNEKRASDINILLDIINREENIILFHDTSGEAYISFQVKDHIETWGCKTKFVRRWLSNEFWNRTKSAANSEAIKNIISVLDARASFSGPEYSLKNRFAWEENNLWYDLTNNVWSAVRINSENWEIIASPPILFRRYAHNCSQVLPARDKGDLSLLLNYVNITDPQHKLLLMVYVVSCFIPDFANPMLVIFGSQGSAKTTLAKLLRLIIDPSIIEVVSMPDNPKELIQALAHHAFLFFDNVSYISENISDILCKVITGSGFTKRELYSDDEDIIYTLKRPLGINGINLVGTRPDLLERSLIIELSRIEPENRKSEMDLMENFERELPQILAGIFDVLVKAIKIRPTIKLESLPRMADFTLWGCAISEALGYTQKDFLDAYEANITTQTDTILTENIVAAAIISFMDSKFEWSGTATELLRQLNTQAFIDDVSTYEKYWPKGSNVLMRRLNELKVNLKEVGITYVCTPGNTREITITKVEKNKTDDTDGI